ncbi:MerR family transcriptional regulator [bacterium]|nr:MerR family transcriptional regulator [bacterium]
MQQVYSIGSLASSAGVPVSTVRYYERIGLLLPRERSDSGYRQYGEAELERLRFVRLCQSVGFSLDDAAALLALRDGNEASRDYLSSLARIRLDVVDAQIAQLCDVRNALQAAISTSLDNCNCSRCADLQLLQQKLG